MHPPFAPFSFLTEICYVKKTKEGLSDASDILFLSDRKSGNNQLFKYAKLYRNTQRVEEHAEADIELKATAFSTQRINMFTQTITVNEIIYISSIKISK